MIKKTAANRENSALAIDTAQAVSGRLGNSIRRGGSQRGLFIAQSVQIAVHLRTGGLIDAGIRLLALDDVQQARQSANVDVERRGRNLPASRDENLSREIINFIRRRLGKGDFQRGGIAHVGIQEFNLVLDGTEPAHGSRLAAYQTINAVSEVKQVFRKIAAVLAGNAGN